MTLKPNITQSPATFHGFLTFIKQSLQGVAVKVFQDYGPVCVPSPYCLPLLPLHQGGTI